MSEKYIVGLNSSSKIEVSVPFSDEKEKEKLSTWMKELDKVRSIICFSFVENQWVVSSVEGNQEIFSLFKNSPEYKEFVS